MNKNLKAGVFVGIGVVAFIVCMYLISLSVKTQARRLENSVETAAADITIVEKERTDKLDLLFSTVKATAKHEEKIIDSITDSRKQIDADLENGNVGAASNALDAVKNDINILVEAYPTISATTAYQEFMNACTISESKIAGHRTNYNASVKEYNNFIDGAINQIFLNMSGYDEVEFDLLDYGKEYEDPKVYNWEE